MLSQKARYALRAMLQLAEVPPGGQMLTGDLATAADVPRKFLEQILLDLKRDGLVTSTRGRAGGYRLARAAHTISFAEILRTIDGPLALTPCASRTAFQRCKDCKSVEDCAIRHALLDVRDATAGILEARMLAVPPT
jgi:Rrf2 family protein